MKKIILLIVLLVVLGSGGTAYWAYQDLHRPNVHGKSGQYIEIGRGSAPGAVVKRLATEGVIKHEWPLMLYMKFTGAGSRLKAGEYVFPSPITPLNVLRRLELGEQRTMKLTVIEGWTRWDIARAMAGMPEFKLNDSSDALKLMDDVSQIQSIDPQATNLEGYLFPDTYEFPPGTPAKTVIEMMVKRFFKEWSPETSLKAQALNLTPRQIVTTASLIETEAKLSEERPLVASVIYNRIQRNMPLGIDSTVIYASKLAGKWRNDGKVYKSDVDRVSPYNTRLRVGLPPGPIASAGASSLEAALNPRQTDFLYYVRDPARNDGAHNFYARESDFGKGVQALRDWERQRDAENAARKNQPTP
ncbi:MAG TPA: endolytic transglycosylase MltG [Pyrinomonadaceae bacterium]|nr:endolytic transglycosylase MltG [Pyrinomonadaceae bacterium]